MANSHILVGAITNPLRPVVRRISTSDLYYALARGYDDLAAFPSYAVFLCVIYPLLGILLIGLTSGTLSLLPLAVPIAAGFALVGPVAAIGLYELSRRREAGLDSSPSHVFDVLHSPSLGAIIALSVLLMAIYLIWLVVAYALYIVIFGYSAPASIEQFITDLLTTPRGWTLIIARWGTKVYTEAIQTLTGQAVAKLDGQRRSLTGHLIRSALAGMYVGAAIVQLGRRFDR